MAPSQSPEWATRDSTTGRPTDDRNDEDDDGRARLPHGRPRGAAADASPEDRGDLLPGDGGRPEPPAHPDRRRGLDDLAETLESAPAGAGAAAAAPLADVGVPVASDGAADPPDDLEGPLPGGDDDRKPTARPGRRRGPGDLAKPHEAAPAGDAGATTPLADAGAPATSLGAGDLPGVLGGVRTDGGLADGAPGARKGPPEDLPGAEPAAAPFAAARAPGDGAAATFVPAAPEHPEGPLFAADTAPLRRVTFPPTLGDVPPAGPPIPPVTPTAPLADVLAAAAARLTPTAPAAPPPPTPTTGPPLTLPGAPPAGQPLAGAPPPPPAAAPVAGAPTGSPAGLSADEFARALNLNPPVDATALDGGLAGPGASHATSRPSLNAPPVVGAPGAPAPSGQVPALHPAVRDALAAAAANPAVAAMMLQTFGGIGTPPAPVQPLQAPAVASPFAAAALPAATAAPTAAVPPPATLVPPAMAPPQVPPTPTIQVPVNPAPPAAGPGRLSADAAAIVAALARVHSAPSRSSGPTDAYDSIFNLSDPRSANDFIRATQAAPDFKRLSLTVKNAAKLMDLFKDKASSYNWDELVTVPRQGTGAIASDPVRMPGGAVLPNVDLSCHVNITS